MTDLLSRPTKPAGDAARDGGPPPRPLTTNAMIAGVAAAGISLVLCMSVAITGWFLADAGAHGDTTDALRVGADAWLMGSGSQLVYAGATIGMIPLGITMVLLVATFRAGRWAGATSAPVDGDRAWALATTMLVGMYAVIAVITCVLASTDGATPALGRTILGSVVLALAGGGLGLAVGLGELDRVRERVPQWVLGTAYGALAGAVALFAAGTATMLVSLVLHLDEAATVFSGLHLGVGEALTYIVVLVLVAPNCVLLTCAYLVGPGFAFGTGTVISPTAVSVGAMPAVPVLAAIPDEGPAPGWMVALMALPMLAGALGSVLAQRRSDNRAYDLGALQGAGAGFGAGLLVTIAIVFAGGPLGTGRLAEIGAPFFEVLVIAVGGMGLAGMLGGLAMTWWQRRGERPAGG